MDVKILAIAAVAIIAVAGGGVAAFFALNSSDHDGNQVNEPNYGLGYEMKSSVNWKDSSSVNHSGIYTFTTREATESKLVVEVSYDEDSTHLKTNITVIKGTMDGNPYYTATFGKFDPLEGVFSEEKNAWIAVTNHILSTDKNENMMNRMYELAVTAFASITGSYTVDVAELFSNDAPSTIVSYMVRLVKVPAGFYSLSDFKDKSGVLHKCNLSTSGGIIRSDDVNIQAGLTSFNALIVDTITIGGKEVNCLHYRNYDEDGKTDSNKYYTMDGTMLLYHTELNDSGDKVVHYQINSITYP